MAELSKGHVFVPGEVVDPADLNDLVDAATALKGIVMDQPSATPVQADDSVVFYDLSADDLARCKISALPSGVTSIGLTATPATVFGVSGSPITTSGTLALSLDSQGPNKFLAGPVSGSVATPTFRVLSPADLPSATVDIAATQIDWDLGNCFRKTLTTNTSFTFVNPSEGQIIRVLIAQDASHTVAWPIGASGVYWPDGVKPVMTTGAGRHDIYTFQYIAGNYWGTFAQDFQAV